MTADDYVFDDLVFHCSVSRRGRVFVRIENRANPKVPESGLPVPATELLDAASSRSGLFVPPSAHCQHPCPHAGESRRQRCGDGIAVSAEACAGFARHVRRLADAARSQREGSGV